MTTAYIAGPMRHWPDFNFPAFFKAAVAMRAAGLTVFNPAEHDVSNGFDPSGLTGYEDLARFGFDLRAALRDDLIFVAYYADLVVVLPRWEDSMGAQAEVATALALGVPVMEFDPGPWCPDTLAPAQGWQFAPAGFGTMPASEVRDLVDTFNEMHSDRVAERVNDEDDLPFTVESLTPLLNELNQAAEDAAIMQAELDHMARLRESVRLRESIARLEGDDPESRASGEEADLGWHSTPDPWASVTGHAYTEPRPDLQDFEGWDDVGYTDETDEPETVEVYCMQSAEPIRVFETGATRDSNVGKFEYARFFDPRVLEARAAYMDMHRHLPNGTLREPDDWKKGIPIRAYMDGLFRHVMDVWLLHDYDEAVRPESGEHVDLVEALCAVMFNAEGWLHSILNEDQAA